MSHPINKQRIFTLLFLILIFVTSRASAADSNERGYSLLIYGSGGVGNWNQSFNASLSQLLGSEFGQYFTPEFLPLITAQADELETFANALALKHSNKQIDLVVALLEEDRKSVV